MKLSTIELDTLLLLANLGPLTGYDLHSKKKGDGSGGKADTNIMSDVYWLQVRKKLLDYNLIEEVKEKGRKKPYKVSVDGFDYLIQNYIDEIHNFDDFVEYCRDYFPLVFGYWRELERLGLDEYVRTSLTSMINEIYLDVIRELALGLRKRFTHKEFIEALYIRLYLPELFYGETGNGSVQYQTIQEFRENQREILEFIKQWINEKRIRLESEIKKLDRVYKTY